MPKYWLAENSLASTVCIHPFFTMVQPYKKRAAWKSTATINPACTENMQDWLVKTCALSVSSLVSTLSFQIFWKHFVNFKCKKPLLAMQSLSLTVRLKLVKSLIRDRRTKINKKTKVVCFLKYTKGNWLAFTSANYYIKTSWCCATSKNQAPCSCTWTMHKYYTQVSFKWLCN